jgi:uncharacterized protein
MHTIWMMLVLLTLSVLPVRAEVPVPGLQHRVTDLTGTLTPDQRTDLERRLAAFEAEKGSQIAVLIVPTTQPETIEQYSIRAVDAWKLGRKNIDDGILVLMAKQDRTLRIEVGQGLEGIVPDAIAKRIIEEDMAPQFKQGDVYGGLVAGIDRLIALIHGETLPPLPPKPNQETNSGTALGMALMGGIFGGHFLRFIFGPFLGGLIAGIGAGILLAIVGLPMLFSLLIGGFVFLAVISGLGRGGPSGYYGGSGGFRSAGGTGGFSGGGGGFSGGGASGRW